MPRKSQDVESDLGPIIGPIAPQPRSAFRHTPMKSMRLERVVEKIIDVVGIVIIIGVLVAVFLGFMQYAVRAHENYNGWRQPGTGASCCSGVDCYPTTARFRYGSWYALRREDRKWLRVPSHLILSNQSPIDGNAHICAPPPAGENETVFCFVPPQSGT